jgi:hypothetical protein
VFLSGALSEASIAISADEHLHVIKRLPHSWSHIANLRYLATGDGWGTMDAAGQGRNEAVWSESRC